MDWKRGCFKLSVRFLVVKAVSLLSIQQLLRRGLDLNLGDGERKGDVFGEVLDALRVNTSTLE